MRMCSRIQYVMQGLIKMFLGALIFFFFSKEIMAQHIPLKNASFEKWSSGADMKRIDDISNIGFPFDWSEKNIRYVYAKGPQYRRIKKEAFDGKYYVFLVDSENLIQELEVPLQKDSTYTIFLALAFVENHVSEYPNPLHLKILGSELPKNSLDFPLENKELDFLGKTLVASHTNWLIHEVTFKPEKDIRCLVLQASRLKAPYDGHILIDSVSILQNYKKPKEISLENKVLVDQLERRFKGGEDAFLSHFRSWMFFPKETRNHCRVGRVNMYFKITEKGEIVDLLFSNVLDKESMQMLTRTFVAVKDEWLTGEEEEVSITFAFAKSDMPEIEGDLKVLDTITSHDCPKSEMLVQRLETEMKSKSFDAAEVTIKELLKRFPDSKEYHQIKKIIEQNK